MTRVSCTRLSPDQDRECLEKGVASMNRGELAEFVCVAQHAYGATGWKEGGKWKVPARATIR